MTKPKKPNVFEDFVSERGKLDDIALTLRQAQKDPRPNVLNPAKDKITKTAHEYATANGFTQLPLDGYAQDQEVVSNHFNLYQRGIVRNAARKYSENLEDFVTGINEKTLDALIAGELNPENDRPMIKSALLKDNKELFQVYQTRLILQEQIKRFEEGKLADEKEKEMFLRGAAEGYAKELEKKFKEKYKGDKDYIEAVMNETRRAVLRGHITDEKKLRTYATSSLKESMKEIDKKFASLGSSAKVYAATREAIKKVASIKDPDVVEPLVQTLYALHNATK